MTMIINITLLFQEILKTNSVAFSAGSEVADFPTSHFLRLEHH